MKASNARVARRLVKKEVSRVKPQVELEMEADPHWAKRLDSARRLMLAAIEEKKPQPIVLQLTTEFERLLKQKNLL